MMIAGKLNCVIVLTKAATNLRIVGITLDVQEVGAEVAELNKIQLYKNRFYSTIVTQTKVNYDKDSGEQITRVAGAYHETIVEGHCETDSDYKTPNFTALGASVYNKAKGNVGATAITGRVDDVAYQDIDMKNADDTDILGASKSCGAFLSVTRRANYDQGRHNASYSIGMETYVINAPTEDGPDGTEGYYGNSDYAAWKTWTNGYHCVVGGRRPVSAGIMMNGYSGTYRTSDNKHTFKLRNGQYNGIIIGASSMAIRGGVPVKDENGEYLTDESGDLIVTDGNSPETVGINVASWTQKGNYGFYVIKAGYAPRFLKSRGSALFESPGAKFLNPNGDMPFAISAQNTPYIDFKTGSESDYYENGIPLERPTDSTHARIGYVSSNDTLNLSSTGGLKFTANRQFTAVSDTSAEGAQESDTTTTVNYSMTGESFYPSSSTNLGTSAHKWGNIYANTGTILTSDRNAKTDISDIDDKLLKAWSKVGYKTFRFKDGSRKHIGLIAQDIQAAFESEGLDAHDYGLFCEDVDENGNKILGVRYSECLALECALLRNRLGA